MNTVLLITNEEDIKKTLFSNIVLLRESDIFLCAEYKDAQDIVYDKRPDIVIVHENSNRDTTINIIKYIKEKTVFYNTNIILLLNKQDREFVLNAYDDGIDDYFTVDADPSEMLIRTINCIKKSEQNKEIKNLGNYLACYGIKSAQSGFYSAKFSKEIFELELINHDFLNGSFMIISPDEEGKKLFSESKINSAIKKSVRSGDAVAESFGSKYYFMLHCSTNAALTVFDKIKTELPKGFTLKAGISDVNTRNFSNIEKQATCALNEALLTGRDYVIYSCSETVSENWLVENNEEEKSYKFFKGIFEKKLENVIAPVFYRLQKTYEEKLINTRIEQFTDGKKSVFRLINSGGESRLTIVYPGFSKAVICMTHSGLESPENSELSLSINKITQKGLAEIVENFINEFVSYINKEKI